VNAAHGLFTSLVSHVDRVVIGKREAKTVLFSAFLAKGNVLLEGVPGIAKTLMARAWARALGLRFSRIQFTPDLMPSDILGTSVFHQGKGVF
jgi:MoxR-like ATPase